MKQYIIKKEDIGKGGMTPLTIKCDCCGNEKTTFPFEPLGKVLPQDVGKMCKYVNGVWFVENESLFKKRINK